MSLALLMTALVVSQVDAGVAELPAAPVAIPEAQLHDELRVVRDQMEKALNAQDLDGLMKHLDERVVFSTMNGDVVIGHQGVRDYFTKMLQGPDARVKKVQAHFEATELSRLYGQTLATAYGTTNDSYELKDGMQFSMKAQWSTTLSRGVDGNWKILTFHYSANVFDNAVRDLELGLFKKVAIGAGLLALIIGLVIGRMTKK